MGRGKNGQPLSEEPSYGMPMMADALPRFHVLLLFRRLRIKSLHLVDINPGLCSGGLLPFGMYYYYFMRRIVIGNKAQGPQIQFCVPISPGRKYVVWEISSKEEKGLRTPKNLFST